MSRRPLAALQKCFPLSAFSTDWAAMTSAGTKMSDKLSIASDNLRKLSAFVSSETQHTDLVLGNYVWLEQLNKNGVENGVLWKGKYLFYWIKYGKHIKSLKIKGISCYDINITCISFPKDGLLKFVKFEFRHVSSFSCIWKKYGKVSGKTRWRFDIILLICSICFLFIAYENYC